MALSAASMHSDGFRRATVDAAAVVAVMPTHSRPPSSTLVADVLRRIGALVIVDDGSPAAAARELDRLASATGAELVRLRRRCGKGAALNAGLAAVSRRDGPVRAVLTIDADGQHPPSAIPSFLDAAQYAELVVGDRFGDLHSMPWERRIANVATSGLVSLATGVRVRDTQCGMRLLRGRALQQGFEEGGYESETRQLKRCLRAGISVAWVPIPAIYDGAESSFRPVRDSMRVLVEVVRPARP
jgi:glycosyltransferase involved in cell wall biosynthesis